MDLEVDLAVALEGTKEKPQPCASSNLDAKIGKPATVTSFIPSALVEAEEEVEAAAVG